MYVFDLNLNTNASSNFVIVFYAVFVKHAASFVQHMFAALQVAFALVLRVRVFLLDYVQGLPELMALLLVLVVRVPVLVVEGIILVLAQPSVVLLKHAHAVLRAGGGLRFLVIRVFILALSDAVHLLSHLLLARKSFGLFLLPRLFLTSNDVLANRFHEGFVLRHLLKGPLYILDYDKIRERRAQLQELLQVRVLRRLLADALLLQQAEEVLRVDDVKRLPLGLAAHILLEDNVLEELSGGNLLLHQEEHQHHHDLHRLLVQLRQVNWPILLLLAGFRLLLFLWVRLLLW